MVVMRVTGIHLVGTFAALLVLATASLLLSFLHMGHGVAMTVALLFAGTKALLVMWFFMHLLEEPLSARMVVIVSVLMVALLVILTSLDVTTRRTFPPRPSPTESSPYER